MDEGKIISRSKLNFTFEGGYEVDAAIVSKSIDGLVNLMTITANSFSSDSEFRLSISAIRPGSLEIDFNAIALSAASLLNANGLQYAKTALDIILAFFNIKKHLAGEKPKSTRTTDESVVVENAKGDILTAPKGANVYFQNAKIDTVIVNMFNGLKDRDQIQGLTLKSDSGESVILPRESFDSMATPIDAASGPNIIEFMRKNEVLFIKKPDLRGDSVWEFQSDKKIPAEMKDEDFIQAVRENRIKLGGMTSLVVDMLVKLELGSDGLPVERNSKYTITKVHKVQEPGEGQITLT